MNAIQRKVLLSAINGYTKRNEQRHNSGGLSQRWAQRLQEVVDQIEEYTLDDKDQDLLSVIEEHIEWLSISYSIRSHDDIETLNQIYYSITGIYSPVFYESIVRNRR